MAALEPHALFRVGGMTNYRCNGRRRFSESASFSGAGTILAGITMGVESGQILEKAAQTSKYHGFLMRRRAVFLRNHSISWEMAGPDAIWLQNALVSRSPVPPSWSGTASRRTFIRNRLFHLGFAMIRPTGEIQNEAGPRIQCPLPSPMKYKMKGDPGSNAHPPRR